MKRPNNAIDCPAKCGKWKLQGGEPVCHHCMQRLRTSEPAAVKAWANLYHDATQPMRRVATHEAKLISLAFCSLPPETP